MDNHSILTHSRDGDVCNAVLGELMHINYDNQEATANPGQQCTANVLSNELIVH